MASSKTTPENIANSPQLEADSPPQILIRPPTLLDLAKIIAPQETTAVVEDANWQLKKEDQYDSEASTDSGSTSQAASLIEHDTETDADGLPIIKDCGRGLAMLLRIHQIKAQDLDIGGFWTFLHGHIWKASISWTWPKEKRQSSRSARVISEWTRLGGLCQRGPACDLVWCWVWGVAEAQS